MFNIRTLLSVVCAFSCRHASFIVHTNDPVLHDHRDHIVISNNLIRNACIRVGAGVVCKSQRQMDRTQGFSRTKERTQNPCLI